MVSKFDKIFFDLDGTLSDSYKGIENGLWFAMRKSGIKDLTEKEIKSLIGVPLNESLKNIFGNDNNKIAEVIKSFREYYDNFGIYESELYPGIKEILHELSLTSDLYVITAKPAIYATKLLVHHNIASLFTNILGCQLDGISFSKTALIRQVPDIQQSIIIGDKPQDISAGKEAGIKTGGVLYGYGTKQEITNSNPDFIIDSVPALREILFK